MVSLSGFQQKTRRVKISLSFVCSSSGHSVRSETVQTLSCLIEQYTDWRVYYIQIFKKTVKDSAAIFGLDKAWFDTQSVRMSAPTIARAVHAPTTVIMHMGQCKSLPAAMKYQEQSTGLNDSKLSMVSDPTLFTAEDVRLTQLLMYATPVTVLIEHPNTVRRFSLINYWHNRCNRPS